MTAPSEPLNAAVRHRQRAEARQPRPLSRTQLATAALLGLAALGIAGLGFVSSFEAVSAAVRPSFGALAWTVPLGVDLGILVFSALDLLLARLNMPVPWLRAVPIGLTAGTVWLNIAAGHTITDKIAHALMPALWVVFIEVARHAVRTRAGLAAGTRMDRVRVSRWLLAPLSTAALWRRMVLWEVTSYRDALALERDRVARLARLRDTHGPLVWRVRASLDERLALRLGPADTDSDSGTRHDAAPRHEPAGAPDRDTGQARPESAGAAPPFPRDLTGIPTLPAPELASPGHDSTSGVALPRRDRDDDTRQRAGRATTGNRIAGRGSDLVNIGTDVPTEPEETRHDTASGTRHDRRDSDSGQASPDTGSDTRHGRGDDTDPLGTDLELEALAILTAEPNIAGAELGRRLGRTARTGQRLRSRLADHTPDTT